MRRLTEEARQKGTLAAREARKKAPSRREKMARYAQTFARQRAEYGRHKHKLIGLPLVDKVEQGSMARRPRGAPQGDFEVSAAEKSPQRCLRVLAESSQEFIRAGKSLPVPFRRDKLSFQSRNRGPRRCLSGKDRAKERPAKGEV
jgi:hypothetical protein